jgi:hypothetical protein
MMWSRTAVHDEVGDRTDQDCVIKLIFLPAEDSGGRRARAR